MRFSTTTHGKWILSGEHTVLRGGWALAFPLKTRGLTLTFEPSAAGDSFAFQGSSGAEFRLLFEAVMSRAFELLGLSVQDRRRHTGAFQIESDLPVGAGLGASASLVVAIGRWAVHRGLLAESEIFEFARNLENLFHGESSGLDVAVTLHNRGVKFRKANGASEISRLRASDSGFSPYLAISYTGVRGITADCVTRVKKIAIEDPESFGLLDSQMKKSVEMCERAISVENGTALEDGFSGRESDKGEEIANSEAGGSRLREKQLADKDRFELLRAGIELAGSVFEKWGLTEGVVANHIDDLKRSGAAAVKPTGSGGGGYVLSLWPEVPTEALISQLGLIQVMGR